MKQFYLDGKKIRISKRIFFDDLTVDILKEEAGEFEFKYTYVGDDETKNAYVALIPCGFDIEAYEQFMYIWTFTFNDLTVIGYTWEEFNVLLNMIKEALSLGREVKHIKHRDGTKEDKLLANKILPVYIHNLRYEYSFMKHEVSFNKPSFMDSSERNPMYLIANQSILIIDSAKVFPMKLEAVAKAYCVTQKTHDLDYTVPRNIIDAKRLSDKELNYCCCDTRILAELMRYYFENHFCVYDRLALTQNQMVKAVIKHRFNEVKDKDLVNKIKSMYITQDQYLFIRDEGFRGGYCASSKGENDKNEKVGYVDLTSAYLRSILHNDFPISGYEQAEEEGEELKELIGYYCERFCCQMSIIFKSLKAKGNKLIKLESKDNVSPLLPGNKVPVTRAEKTQARKSIITNDSGRITYAECILVSLTEIDWELYNKVYEWEDFEILSLIYANKGPLPDYIKEAAIELYEKKAKLKKAGKTHSPEYFSAKTLVSNIFGAMVQRYDKYLFELTSEQFKGKTMDKILKPQWGVYVTAHVRKILIDIILEIGKEYWLYTDTDSVYFILNEHTRLVIARHNAKMKLKNALLCQKYNLDFRIFDDLGCFDDEHSNDLTIYHFKTIGSKAYIYYYTDKDHPNGDYKLVLAGIPEEDFWKSYYAQYKELKEEYVFAFFKNTANITFHRKKVQYVDEPTEMIINGVKCVSKSGCKIVEETINGKLTTVQEITAIEEAFNEMEDSDRLI